MEYNFSFNTAFNQFYIKDKDASGDTGAETFWSEEAFLDRLAMDEGILGVSTTSYGLIKGTLCLLDSPKLDIDLDRFDHIIEAGIQLKSGILQIADSPNLSVELQVKLLPGFYRARINSSNLEPTGDDDGDDFYLIEVWSDKNESKKVLKRWSN